MYGFFSTLNNSTNVGMESMHSSASLSPWQIAGLAIGAVVVLGGSIYSGWCLYRRCCSESARVAPANNVSPDQEITDVAEVRNPAGKLVSTHVIYRNNSTRTIPAVVIDEDAVVSITLR